MPQSCMQSVMWLLKETTHSKEEAKALETSYNMWVGLQRGGRRMLGVSSDEHGTSFQKHIPGTLFARRESHDRVNSL